ncbi:hypothetical protein [Microcoleus sp. herbarium12]|uniref:hypothetical protein n=1 Tax=Microcoleus sp. herbarium12 TaxID=3055437 RepID=UPI002FCEC73F
MTSSRANTCIPENYLRTANITGLPLQWDLPEGGTPVTRWSRAIFRTPEVSEIKLTLFAFRVEDFRVVMICGIGVCSFCAVALFWENLSIDF